ncbi:MAG: CRTAC1 family protein [Bacteroidota bacterium]
MANLFMLISFFRLVPRTLMLIWSILGSTLVLEAQIGFSEISRFVGVNSQGNHHGLAVGDFNQDGWEDIYVSCRMGPNLLFHNQGDGTFLEIAADLGLAFEGDTRLALWGDINNDSWPDLFIGSQDEGDRLFLNRGDGSFQDISLESQMLIDAGPAMGAAFADVDNDGWLDLYVTRHYRQNTFYHNRGGKRFENIIMTSGATDTTAAMGLVFFDYDNDRDLDLYLVHDANFPNKLYQNDGKGHFTDVSLASGANYAGFGMGVDVADFNQDGWLDIYIANFFANVLYLNMQDGSFVNIAASIGLDDPGMGWGTCFFDADNDGLEDIYLGNGQVPNNLVPTLPNALFQNRGLGGFVAVSEQSDLASPHNSFGVVRTDFDKDGKVDIVVANLGDTANCEIFHNQSQNAHHWLAVKLEGSLSNRMAIGARVEIKVEGKWRVRALKAGSSWASQSSSILYFGLGSAEKVDSLLVKWPSGHTDYYQDISVDQYWKAKELSPINCQSAVFSPFPNPLASHQALFIPTQSNDPLILSDLQGKVILLPETQYHSATGCFRLDLGEVMPGIYVLRQQDQTWKIRVE